jgi:membrane protein
MSMTMSALDRCYELPLQGARPFWKQRLLAIAMTVVIVVLILCVVVLLPVGTIVKNWVLEAKIPYVEDGPLLIVLFDVVRWVLALLFMISVLTVLYHFGPSVKHQFRWITPGAVFSIVAWILLGLLFRFYIDKYGKYDKTYGSVAGVAILLLVFYIDGVVLLIGAEINSEIDFEVLKIKRGTRDFRPAEAVEPPKTLFDDQPAPST